MGTFLRDQSSTLHLLQCGILALLLSLAAHTAFAQKVQFGGTIRDSITGEALPLVGVMLEGTDYGVNTNLDGKFIMVVPAGEYVMIIRASGYDAYRDTLRLDQDAVNAKIVLQPVSLDLDDIVITSKAVNPAHRVIRNAIAHRSQWGSAVASNSANSPALKNA